VLHFYESVPGWFWWEDLYSEAVKAAPDKKQSHFVEVGAWLGKSTIYMAVEIANSGKLIKFDCVDTWLGSTGADVGVFNVYFQAHANDQDAAYKEFLGFIEPVKDYITPIRMDSISASKLYADESLDFVFIDADHEYENALADIKAWYPKVKIGGMIGGDDFGNATAGISRAVTELIQNFHLNNIGFCWIATKRDKCLI